MRNARFTKVDIKNGICPGCGVFGPLAVEFKSKVQSVRACGPRCWNIHFAAYFGTLEDVGGVHDADPGVARSTHQKNSTSFTAYGPDQGRDPDPVGRAAAVRIVDNLIADRLRDQRILDAAAEVVRIWNDGEGSPGKVAAARFVLSGNWRALHDALIQLAKSAKG